MPYTLGFIGAGNMAEAIAKAAIAGKVVPAEKMIAADPSEARRQVFEKLKIAVTDDNAAAIAGSACVLLAVKPQMLASVAPLLAAHLTDGHVVVSIMAGITSAKLEAAIGRPARIVRVMPNTPMMVGKGMAGVAPGSHARTGDDELALELFTAGGSHAIRVKEAQLDAITAVSGSGPAYLFYLAEAMHDAAAQLGLAEHADTLVRQTLLGAATLLDTSPDTPAELRRKVTSPGGTTEAAIRVLDERAIKAAVVEALKAAEARGKELGTADERR